MSYTYNRRFFVATLIAMPLAISAAMSLDSGIANAKDPIYTGLLSNTAVGGYDTVAYFTENKAVKGSSKYQTTWHDVKWLFSSPENLAAFKKAPTKYTPQYGGHCAYGVAQNALVKGDPTLWQIVDGKLYLNINKQIADKWQQSPQEYITTANQHWPELAK